MEIKEKITPTILDPYVIKKEAKKLNNRHFISLLVANGMMNLNCMNFISFFPLYTEHYHPTITTLQIGIILSIYQIITVVASPFVGNYLNTIGRKRAILISYCIDCCTSFSYAMLSFVSDSTLFYTGTICVRILEGVGGSLLETPVYSLVAIEFPEDKDKYISYVELAAGIGLTVGPFISVFMYNYLHFAGTFLTYSSIIFCTLIFLYFNIPDKFNQKVEEEFDEENKGGEEKVYEKISYKHFFTTPDSAILLIACVCGMVFSFYYEAILSVRLSKELGIQETNVGFFFLLISMTYLTASPLTAYLMGKISKQSIIVLGFCVSTLGSLFAGPSQAIGLPDEIWVMCIGLGLIGLSGPMLFIPVLPLLIEIMENQDFLNKNDPTLMDKASGIYTSISYSGLILSPIISGYLMDYWGFKFTCDYMAISSIIVGFMFYKLNGKLKVNKGVVKCDDKDEKIAKCLNLILSTDLENDEKQYSKTK